jgi:hypothetical protein
MFSPLPLSSIPSLLSVILKTIPCTATCGGAVKARLDDIARKRKNKISNKSPAYTYYLKFISLVF